MSYNSKYKGAEVESLLDSISNKVDKVDGKQLSTEDFTTLLKQKLDGLSNYDDTEISQAVSKLRTDLDALVSGDTTTAIDTFNEVIAFLDGISETEDLSGIIANIEQQIASKYTKPSGGIPKSDLVQAVQTSLGKADSALQSHQSIYTLTFQSGTFASGSFTANSGNKTINIPTTTSHISEGSNLYFTNARAVSALGDTLKSYVTLSGSQTVSGEKNFTGGLKVNGSPIVYDAAKKYWKLEGDLLITGGLTMYGSDSSFTPSTIMDAIAANLDPNTLAIENGLLTVIGGGSGSISEITKQMVIDALGFTPISSSDVPTVLPNPHSLKFGSKLYDGSASKTILASDLGITWDDILGRPTLLSSFTDDVVAGNYLPLTGGTIDGTLKVTPHDGYVRVIRKGNTDTGLVLGQNSGGHTFIGQMNQEGSTVSRQLSIRNYIGPVFFISAIDAMNVYSYVNGTSGKLGSLAIKTLADGNKRCAGLFVSNNSENRGGMAIGVMYNDITTVYPPDSWNNPTKGVNSVAIHGDIVTRTYQTSYSNSYYAWLKYMPDSNTLDIRAISDIQSADYSTPIQIGDVQINGKSVIHSGNIASQSVNYAASTGNADTLDGKHLSDILASNVASATKATQDGSGNVITSTYATKADLSGYLPLTGGVMTGNVRINWDTTSGSGILGNDKSLFLIGDLLQRRSLSGTFYDIIDSGNYSSYALPLSGGTISGFFAINGSVASYTQYKVNNAVKGEVGWHSNYGIFIKNETSKKFLNITDEGLAQFDGNSLIHSGNIGSQSVNYATSAGNANALDNMDSTDFFRILGTNNNIDDFGDDSKLNGVVYINATEGETHNAPFSYGSVLSINHKSSSWMIGCQSNGKLMYRHRWWSASGVNWSDWKTLAFTDSDITGNAASATKLQTARTIWGQSFDGTGNIDGMISINDGLGIKNTTQGWRLLTDAYMGDVISNGGVELYSSKGVTLSAGSVAKSLHLNSEGNVGIGTTEPSQKLHVDGNILTTGGITMYSQRSLKNVVDERGLSLEELRTIKPTRYTWKDGRDDRIHFGGIADDIQQVLPEVVYNANGVLTMDYGNAGFAVASSLIQHVIRHENEITSLKRKVRELEEEVKRLKSV